MIDVIYVNESLSNGEVEEPRFASFFFDNPSIRRPIPIQDYELTVSVSGRNAPGDEKTFLFSVDDEYNYHFAQKRKRRRKKA
jgi:hypothetical protein